jgi:hypothetical protein
MPSLTGCHDGSTVSDLELAGTRAREILVSLLEDAAHVGDVVAGFSTLVAVGLGWFELRGWRKQKTAERKSDAAASALVALLTALDAFREWANDLAWWANYEPDPADGEERDLTAQLRKLREAYDRGHQAGLKALADLRTANTLARVHLDKDALRTLGEAQQVFWHIVALYREFDAAMKGGASPDEHLGPLASACDACPAMLVDLAERGTQDLQPIARLAMAAR